MIESLQELPDLPRLEGMVERGLRLWREYEAGIAAGRTPSELLREANEECLVLMLATADRRSRRYAANLVMTELLNRIARLRRTEAPLLNEG